MKRSALYLFAGGLMLGLLLSGDALTGQLQPPGKAPQLQQQNQPVKQKKKFRRRVPNYYGQVGLSDAQREVIYKIQEHYFHQINALEEKIEGMRHERDGRIFNVLTKPQKQRLIHLKQQALNEKAAKAAAKAAAGAQQN